MDHRSAFTEWPSGDGGKAAHRLLIERWAQAVWETDPDGVVVADSPSWRAYTGQTLQEWLGHGWLDAIHPDDRHDAEQQWREATAAHGLVNAEFRLRAPDGGWRWTNVRAAPVLDAKGAVEKWAGINIDIDARKRAEAALRDSEERQTFLLKLSDALASLSDPADIEAAAARLVAGQLGVAWCYFNEFDERGTHATVLGDYHRDGLPSMVGVHDLSGERDFLDLMSSEAMLDMPDLTNSELFSEQGKTAYGALGMRSALGAPLLRGGRLAAVFLVADTSERRWARGNAELLRGVAERTWAAIQRSRAEAALREGEKRYSRVFFNNMAPMAVWTKSGEVVDANDALLELLGYTRAELDAGKLRWDEITPAEYRELDMQAIAEVAAKGFCIPYEKVFCHKDGHPIPIIIGGGSLDEKAGTGVFFVYDLTERQRVETALRDSERHQGLLLAELQHRVRNILTVVRSVARRTADNCEDVDDYVRHLDGRLAALAHVQTILTRDPGEGVSLHALMLDELRGQATSAAQYDVDGPEVALSAKAAEVLGLAIHELATNSTKYGVLGELSGTIRIRWTVEDRDGQDWLCFTWDEPVDSKIERPVRTGFGSELIRDRVPYELRGTGDIQISADEVEVRISFPLVSERSKFDSIAAQMDMKS